MRALQCMSIHTLVIDCDGRHKNNSHFTIEESIAAAKPLRAQQVCHSASSLQQSRSVIAASPLTHAFGIRFFAWGCPVRWACTIPFAKSSLAKTACACLWRTMASLLARGTQVHDGAPTCDTAAAQKPLVACFCITHH